MILTDQLMLQILFRFGVNQNVKDVKNPKVEDVYNVRWNQESLFRRLYTQTTWLYIKKTPIWYSDYTFVKKYSFCKNTVESISYTEKILIQKAQVVHSTQGKRFFKK
jgi:hypothetical protein